MSENLTGIIISYRRGPRTQNPKECLLQFQGVDSVGKAGRLIGRKVAWPVKKRNCRGKIVALHGRKGLVRARFRRGISGQALGSFIEVIG